MEASFGRITARLAEPVDKISDELVALINKNIKPPEQIVASDIFVRAMYVVSDEVNSFGGRFPPDEHQRLASLLIDAPLLVGHRKDKLPIGRNFHAKVVDINGRSWVKSYFYWVKSSEEADALRDNIDKGIYKECSIGFTYLFPECSVCGNDIRSCEHQPLQSIQTGSGEITTHFNYRQIEKVLETSLVYRGALPDTSVTKDLGLEKLFQQASKPIDIRDLSELTESRRYLVVPCYESLAVTVSSDGDGLVVKDNNGTKYDRASEAFDQLQGLPVFSRMPAHLLGLRGKQRCPVRELKRFLDKQPSPVSHLEIKLLPGQFDMPVSNEITSRGNRVSTIRHAVVSRAKLSDTIRSMSTRLGALVWTEHELPPEFPGYQIQPKNAEGQAPLWYEISSRDANDSFVLSMQETDHDYSFVIRHFNLNRLNHGARFIVETGRSKDISSAISSASSDAKASLKGGIEWVKKVDSGYLIRMAGGLTGTFVLRPIKLDGSQRYLFYRLTDDSNILNGAIFSSIRNVRAAGLSGE